MSNVFYYLREIHTFMQCILVISIPTMILSSPNPSPTLQSHSKIHVLLIKSLICDVYSCIGMQIHPLEHRWFTGDSQRKPTHQSSHWLVNTLHPFHQVRMFYWFDLMKVICQQQSCCELVHLHPPSPASGSNNLLEYPQHDVLWVIRKAVWNGCPILGWATPIHSFSALWPVLRFCISHHPLYKKASTIRIKSYTLLEVKTCIFRGQHDIVSM